MAAEFSERKVIESGINLLLNSQTDAGDWLQESIVGVFNYNCMITYANYRNIFPVWALSRYYNRTIQG
jgi:squalene cyclase